MRPENLEHKFNAPQHDPGEECDIPEPFRINKDLLLEEIAKFKSLLGEENLTNKIRKALRIVEDETTNLAPGRNSMRIKQYRGCLSTPICLLITDSLVLNMKS